MRLLTHAAQSPAPRSQEEALKLVLQLAQVFRDSRAVPQAEHQNGSIERALMELLEARYGAEVFADGQPPASLWRTVEADYKRGMEEEKAEREAPRAAREQRTEDRGQATGTGDSKQGAGDAGPEQGIGKRLQAVSKRQRIRQATPRASRLSRRHAHRPSSAPAGPVTGVAPDL